MSLCVWSVHCEVAIEEERELEHIAIHGRILYQVKALIVGKQRIGAVLEQEINDVVVAVSGSPKNWCRVYVASLRVHIRAGSEEKLA